MRIGVGVVGGGVVGNAMARSYMEHAEVRVYDTDVSRRTHSLPLTLQCDMVFVCLPTPQNGEGIDVSALDDFFAEVRGSRTKFAIKSTVPIGTTDRLRSQYGVDAVHSPEFLTARCAVTDAQMPARNIIGGPYESIAKQQLHLLYVRRFHGVPCYCMQAVESEMVKLAQNSFFATKVAFFNELYDLTVKHQASYEHVLDAILADGRIAHSHTMVPGPDGMFGFGGTCLPKDLAQYREELMKAGIEPHIARGAINRNAEDRKSD